MTSPLPIKGSTSMNHTHTTQQRTVLLATDNKNSVIAEVVGDKTTPIAYSAYGHQSAQQDVVTRLGFNGELRESKIGWYLLGRGYRAYNPRLMRFHSPDSWSPFGWGGLNAYMYCVGDPVNRSDPTGHFSLLKFFFAVDRFFSGDPGFHASGGGGGLLGVGAAIAQRAPRPGGVSSTPIGNSPALGEWGATTTRPRPGYAAGAAGDGLTAMGNRSTTRVEGGVGVGGQRASHRAARSSFDEPRTLYNGPSTSEPVLVNERLLGSSPPNVPPQPPPPPPPPPPSSSSSSSSSAATSRDSTPPRSRHNSGGGNNAPNFDDINLRLKFLRRQ